MAVRHPATAHETLPTRLLAALLVGLLAFAFAAWWSLERGPLPIRGQLVEPGPTSSAWWLHPREENRVFRPELSFQGVQAVSLLANTQAMAVGWGGTVLRSTDAGATWQLVSSGTGQDLTSVALLANGQALAVGRNGTVARQSG